MCKLASKCLGAWPQPYLGIHAQHILKASRIICISAAEHKTNFSRWKFLGEINFKSVSLKALRVAKSDATRWTGQAGQSSVRRYWAKQSNPYCNVFLLGILLLRLRRDRGRLGLVPGDLEHATFELHPLVCRLERQHCSDSKAHQPLS